MQLIAALPLPIDPIAQTLTLLPRADASAQVDDWLAPLLNLPADSDDRQGGE